MGLNDALWFKSLKNGSKKIDGFSICPIKIHFVMIWISTLRYRTVEGRNIEYGTLISTYLVQSPPQTGGNYFKMTTCTIDLLD